MVVPGNQGRKVRGGVQENVGHLVNADVPDLRESQAVKVLLDPVGHVVFPVNVEQRVNRDLVVYVDPRVLRATLVPVALQVGWVLGAILDQPADHRVQWGQEVVLDLMDLEVIRDGRFVIQSRSMGITCSLNKELRLVLDRRCFRRILIQRFSARMWFQRKVNSWPWDLRDAW